MDAIIELFNFVEICWICYALSVDTIQYVIVVWPLSWSL